jgi:hypothetical protein
LSGTFKARGSSMQKSKSEFESVDLKRVSA